MSDKYDPRPFQKEFFDHMKSKGFTDVLPWQHGRSNVKFIGVDMAQASGDKTVIAQAIRNKKGITMIYFDEYADLPKYKWYRNPIKWWKWRRLMRKLEKQMEKYTWKNSSRS